MSIGGHVWIDNPVIDAVQAERRACALLVWRECERWRQEEEECRAHGAAEEGRECHWTAEMLKRLAEEIEKRG